MRPYQSDRSRTKVCRDVGTPFLDLQKTITKAVLLQIEAILGIQHASNLSQRIPMALAVTNLPGFEFYDVLKLNTPNPGYLILTPKIPISTSKPYHTSIHSPTRTRGPSVVRLVFRKCHCGLESTVSINLKRLVF